MARTVRRGAARSYMRHKITFLQRTQARDEMGQVYDEFVPAMTVWASVSDLVGNRLWSAQQVHAEAQTEIRMRYVDDIRHDWRVQLPDGRMMEIIGIPADPDGRRRELVMLCRAVRP